MKSVSLWACVVVLPCVCPLTLHHSRLNISAEASLWRCLDDPDTCAARVDEMARKASSMKETVMAEVNDTRKRFRDISAAFGGCYSFMGEESSYKSSFEKKVGSHTSCRRQQKFDHDASASCETLLGMVKSNQTFLCEKESLTQSLADLVPLCAPRAAQPLGTWLQSMNKTFNIKRTEWKRDREACQKTREAVEVQTCDCEVKADTVDHKAKECATILNDLESLSCAWATRVQARCAAYSDCYAAAISRHSAAVHTIEISVLRWQRFWLSATKLECLSGALDASGTVEQAKLEACNGNITDYPWAHIDPPPTKAICPLPDIFPGSSIYNREVYSNLPEDLEVRYPTPCPWFEQGGPEAHQRNQTGPNTTANSRLIDDVSTTG
mmetsp:Transcript_29876/g.79497  ORF Transcript_29876/g.79497 Transcript_29876/m.79497 type:complete len:382 (-) Transcript_29876:56-1201(-)